MRTGGAARHRRGRAGVRLAHGPRRSPNPDADRRGYWAHERVRVVHSALLRLAARGPLPRGRLARRPPASVSSLCFCIL